LRFTESVVEDAALAWLAELGWTVKPGPEIAPGELFAERAGYGEVVLKECFRNALRRLNPEMPEDTLLEAERRVLIPDSRSLFLNNRTFHRLLVDGVTAEFRASDGNIRGHPVQLIDFEDPDANDWVAVNQFTVVGDEHNRRPDIVLFINGLPVAVVELKNPTDEQTDVWSAFSQLQTYKQEIAALFTYNDALIVSDGLEARMGTLTGGKEWFLPWRTIDGQEVEPMSRPQLEVLLKGVFEKRRFLDLLRSFIVFEDDGSGKLAKKMAGYHQFHAVRTAVEATVKASRPEGDQRCGVVWHTQGSGKSLTMAFYAGRIVRQPDMENPTLVVITDRNEKMSPV
jgi:type I restriction enzyme R subunit